MLTLIKTKLPKISALRNIEYYDFQEELDRLYADSENSKKFKNLMRLITSPQNILLAYRNIKKNTGSKTAGVDKKTITHLEKWEPEKLIGYVQKRLDYYVPQAVRRVEIPKSNGKTRPLGIPTIMDRLIQQCVLQVLEPICEAKFFKRSNGFRPNRGAEHAISQAYKEKNRRLKDCMLFNILSFMSNELLGKGSTAASVDELYLFLSNMTTIEYLRNCMKRVRKKDSSVILASQNIEDFLIPSIREFTKPLFSIPTHQFLFNAGQINPKEYMDALQVEPSEFELIKYPERGTCLYRCGNERYLLQVIAPDYKAALFGKSGGR